jgi:hypothetical protein
LRLRFDIWDPVASEPARLVQPEDVRRVPGAADASRCCGRSLPQTVRLLQERLSIDAAARRMRNRYRAEMTPGECARCKRHAKRTAIHFESQGIKAIGHLPEPFASFADSRGLAATQENAFTRMKIADLTSA